MKKYKVIVGVLLLFVIATSAFAQDSGESGINASILTYTGYQLGLVDAIEVTTGAIQTHGKVNANSIASNLTVGLAYQMLFGLTDFFALGFEVGLESSLLGVVSLANNITAKSINVFRLLPRFVVSFGLGDLFSIDALLGTRFGFAGITGLNLLALMSFDFETRFNINFSRNFALFVGLNYIFPIAIPLGDVVGDPLNAVKQLANRAYEEIGANPFDTINSLVPIIGLRVTF